MSGTHFITSFNSGRNCFVASDSGCIIQCVHIASDADGLVKACRLFFISRHYVSCIRSYSQQSDHFTLFFFYEVIGHSLKDFCCCSSFSKSAEKRIFINCHILNISHENCQVTSTITVSRFVSLFLNFSVSCSFKLFHSVF